MLSRSVQPVQPINRYRIKHVEVVEYLHCTNAAWSSKQTSPGSVAKHYSAICTHGIRVDGHLSVKGSTRYTWVCWLSWNVRRYNDSIFYCYMYLRTIGIHVGLWLSLGTSCQRRGLDSWTLVRMHSKGTGRLSLLWLSICYRSVTYHHVPWSTMTHRALARSWDISSCRLKVRNMPT